MTCFGGVLIGVILLLIEYIYFIPVFIPSTDFQMPPLTPCPSTPGKVFSDKLLDGSVGPEMVVVAAGQFRMGDIYGEGANWEQPVHSVFVSRFAISRYEVTFAEYDRFAEATGRPKPDDKGWGRGNRPVINVSWQDATAYTQWLSRQTRQTYRLPTEAEWEYAARAATETQYWWGNNIGSNLANCDGCGSRWNNKKTAPVGSFAANPFKLYDTVGNVYEWTCSEYELKYNGKEQACLGKEDKTAPRVIRGGSWYSSPKFVRAATRYRFSPDYRDNNLGFRVVRM